MNHFDTVLESVRQARWALWESLTDLRILIDRIQADDSPRQEAAASTGRKTH